MLNWVMMQASHGRGLCYLAGLLTGIGLCSLGAWRRAWSSNSLWQDSRSFLASGQLHISTLAASQRTLPPELRNITTTTVAVTHASSIESKSMQGGGHGQRSSGKPTLPNDSTNTFLPSAMLTANTAPRLQGKQTLENVNPRDFPQITFYKSHPNGISSVQQPRAAVVATIFPSSTHYKKEDVLTDFIFMMCSLRKVGSKLPVHAITANVPQEQKDILTGMGVTIHDVTLSIPILQKAYKPIYSREQARRESRAWIAGQTAQGRKDGFATYAKFFAFNLTDFYDVFFHVDTDVSWINNPDGLFSGEGLRFLQKNYFMAMPSDGGRSSGLGFSSSGFISWSSNRIFSDLMRKASIGDYLVFTNGEQEVLEWYYAIPNVTTCSLMRFPCHNNPLCDLPNCELTGQLVAQSKIRSLTCESVLQEFSHQCGLHGDLEKVRARQHRQLEHIRSNGGFRCAVPSFSLPYEQMNFTNTFIP